MLTSVVALLLAIIGPSGLASVNLPTVKQDVCSVKVRYRNGKEAVFVLKWLANRQARKWETVSDSRAQSAARRCQWEFLGEVERRVYLVGPDQGLYVREGLQPVISRLSTERRGVPKECYAASKEYEGALRSFTLTLDAKARESVAADLQTYMVSLRGNAAVAAVSLANEVPCSAAH